MVLRAARETDLTKEVMAAPLEVVICLACGRRPDMV